MTRLETLCKLFNWQGGTIHQAAAELKSVVTIYPIDAKMILGLTDENFDLLVSLYKKHKGN
jgi:hypothetical protein